MSSTATPTTYAIPRFDRLIDWGWFYFLTKPLFYALDFFYKLVGNFGVVHPHRHASSSSSSCSRSRTSPTCR